MASPAPRMAGPGAPPATSRPSDEPAEEAGEADARRIRLPLGRARAHDLHGALAVERVVAPSVVARRQPVGGRERGHAPRVFQLLRPPRGLSPPCISIMFAPPGAITTAAPLRLSLGAAGTSSGTARRAGRRPAQASAPRPGAHDGIVDVPAARPGPAASLQARAARAAAASSVMSMADSVCRDRVGLSIGREAVARGGPVAGGPGGAAATPSAGRAQRPRRPAGRSDTGTRRSRSASASLPPPRRSASARCAARPAVPGACDRRTGVLEDGSEEALRRTAFSRHAASASPCLQASFACLRVLQALGHLPESLAREARRIARAEAPRRHVSPRASVQPGRTRLRCGANRTRRFPYRDPMPEVREVHEAGEGDDGRVPPAQPRDEAGRRPRPAPDRIGPRRDRAQPASRPRPDRRRVQRDVGELARRVPAGTTGRPRSPMPAISAASAGATIAEASGRARHTRRNSQAMTPNSTKWTRSTARIARVGAAGARRSRPTRSQAARRQRAVAEPPGASGCAPPPRRSRRARRRPRPPAIRRLNVPGKAARSAPTARCR